MVPLLGLEMLMSNKRTRNKIARAAPQGGTIISPQQMQVYMAQMQAAQKVGRRTQNNNDALFSPGAPLETQPGINPQGFPVNGCSLPLSIRHPLTAQWAIKLFPHFSSCVSLPRLQAALASVNALSSILCRAWASKSDSRKKRWRKEPRKRTSKRTLLFLRTSSPIPQKFLITVGVSSNVPISITSFVPLVVN